MFQIAGDLPPAAVFGDGEELLDALSLHVGIEDDHAVEVARGASGGLDEAGGAAGLAFLVRVRNGDEGNFRQVEAFAEEVDATSTSNSPLRRVRFPRLADGREWLQAG